MLFHYNASDTTGKVTEGEYDAAGEKEILQYLASHDLQPLSVALVKKRGGGVFGGKIGLEDKIFLTRYLALMLRVGTDLLAAVNILIADFQKPAVKSFLIEVRSNLSQGQPFFQAFASYPRVFSPVFVNLVRAAEASGNLQNTFEQLATSLEKEADLKKRIKSAFIYPIILLIVSLMIFLFLSIFALPRIAKVFGDTGVDPPTFSKIVFTVGLFVGDHVLLLLGTLIGIGAFFFFFFVKTIVGRRVGGQIMRRAPIVKNVFRDLAVQQFASTFSSLIKAGLPIIDATKITADVVSAPDFRASLYRVADEGLARGLTLGDAFRRDAVFPTVVTNLIAISEKAGHLDEVLSTLADFYTSNVDDSIHTLVAFIEPLMLLFMGLLVATIALAIIIPIYQLTSNF